MENLILISSMIFGVINYGLIAKWYVIPALDKWARETALVPLILLHCFRYQGLEFLVPGVVAPDISPAFTIPTAYGDLLTALLGLIAVIALRARWSMALLLVWVFNIVGTLDLLNALPQALLNIHAGQLGGSYYVAAVVVPALLVSHFLIFRLLVRRAEG